MAELETWAEPFCPFDAIGMPARHIDFTPPSQDDFDHAVEKARFVLYAARIKQSEAPALPFNENHVTLAVQYFTQGGTPDVKPVSQQPALNELAWSYAFFSIIVEKGNNTYTRTWTPERLRLDNVVPAAPIILHVKQVQAPSSPLRTSTTTSLASPALRLQNGGETTSAEETGSGNKRKRSASLESDLPSRRSSTHAGALVLHVTAATLFPPVIPFTRMPTATPTSFPLEPAPTVSAFASRASPKSAAPITSVGTSPNTSPQAGGPVNSTQVPARKAGLMVGWAKTDVEKAGGTDHVPLEARRIVEAHFLNNILHLQQQTRDMNGREAPNHRKVIDTTVAHQDMIFISEFAGRGKKETRDLITKACREAAK